MKKLLILILPFWFLVSCASSNTAVYDQFAYQKTIEIKVETHALLDKAITPYNQNLPAIGALLRDIQFITEYEKNRPNNEITTAMWQMLGDKDNNLILGFLRQWQSTQTVSPAFIPEAKTQIDDALNLLLQYEQQKTQSNEQQILNYINSQ